MKKTNLTKQIVEASVMIALATVLSLFKLVEMPYGGSVTLASMLPILVVSYRHGVGVGLLSGSVYAVIQQLLGLNNLSYFTTWQSVVAVMLLDYIVAFTLVGVGGVLRNRMGIKNASAPVKQKIEIAAGMILVCVIRYVCHTVAGATVWAGLSIPDSAALIYSISYNATYMIPETIVSVLVGAWIGEVIDFSKNVPVRFPAATAAKNEKYTVACEVLPHVCRFLILFAAAFDTILIAPHLQDAETGEFTFAYLGEVNWIVISVVTAVLVLAAVTLRIILHRLKKTTME
jgi:thiamine transporter